MGNQLEFDIEIEKDLTLKKEYYKAQHYKRKWEKALQKYCDNESTKEYKNNGFCVCGYMNYCYYCDGDFAKKKCCVKAIKKYCKEENIEIDYNDYNFRKFIIKIEK